MPEAEAIQASAGAAQPVPPGPPRGPVSGGSARLHTAAPWRAREAAKIVSLMTVGIHSRSSPTAFGSTRGGRGDCVLGEGGMKRAAASLRVSLACYVAHPSA